MIDPKAPGVYFEEVATGPRSIEAVGTSTAGFVGAAPKKTASKHAAIAVNSWREFVREFVGEEKKTTALAQAVAGFFDNGGRRCHVVHVPDGEALSGGTGKRRGLDILAEIDEISIVAAPGRTDLDSYQALLEHCEKLGDRVAILDGPKGVKDLMKLTEVATKKSRRRPAGPGGPGAPADDNDSAAVGLRAPKSDKGFGAFYYPWIIVPNALDRKDRDGVLAPPSGAMAGIYARTDVHRAPANQLIQKAGGVERRILHSEQETLNPASVNCIRFFSREGVLVWGARTLAPADSEWRYINVRRLFNMVEESIADATRWVVFEPNDQTLWKSIRRDIGAFLTRLWRQGALMGRTPEEAFFVKCDEETNPPDVVDAGQVVAEIGIAPVKPAEFVIFKIGQHASGTTLESN